MKKLLISVFLLFSLSVHGQEPTGAKAVALPSEAVSIASVKVELEAMGETDQSGRLQLIELEKKYGWESTEVKEAWTKQKAIDLRNIQRLEEIIARYGWPGNKQFGGKAAGAAFLILQHSDLAHQKKYVALAREAVGKGEMRGSSLALLEDRIRSREGGKQIYGSQVTRNSADEWEPLPIEDEENVDVLRARIGLQPISDYLKGFADRSGGRVSPKWTKVSGKKTIQKDSVERPYKTSDEKPSG